MSMSMSRPEHCLAGFHHSDLRLANVMEIFSPRKSGTPDSSINGKEGHENGVSVAVRPFELAVEQ